MLTGVTWHSLGLHIKVGKHITQARLDWFDDEQRSKLGKGKGSKLGEAYGRLG